MLIAREKKTQANLRVIEIKVMKTKPVIISGTMKYVLRVFMFWSCKEKSLNSLSL